MPSDHRLLSYRQILRVKPKKVKLILGVRLVFVKKASDKEIVDFPAPGSKNLDTPVKRDRIPITIENIGEAHAERRPEKPPRQTGIAAARRAGTHVNPS